MSEEFEFVFEFVFKNALLGLVKIFEEGLGKVFSVLGTLRGTQIWGLELGGQ